jgi:hypothetical protein
MTWITPLEVSMSAMITSASLIITLLDLRCWPRYSVILCALDRIIL